MAKVFANYSLDLSLINLNFVYDNPYYTYLSSDFYDDYYATLNNNVYQDVFTETSYDGSVYYLTNYAGDNILSNGNEITGGTATAYIESFYIGSTWLDWWGIQDISYSALDLYSAALTSSTLDDENIFSTLLSGSDVFNLSPYDDKVVAYGGNDIIYGNDGNDDLSGGEGADRVYGQDGVDFISLDEGNDFLHGGSGFDWIYATSNTSVTVDLRILSAQDTGYGMDTILAIENISGGSGDDILKGNDKNNELRGNEGNDKLKGFGGDDILYMDNGNDLLHGGNGEDWVYVDSNIAATIDLTSISIQDTGFGLDRIVYIENISGGSGDDYLKGNNLDNKLIGNEGDDLLKGRGGHDILYLDAGNDILNGGMGIDWLYAPTNTAVTIDLGNTAAQNTGLGMDTIIAIERVFGSYENDILKGNDSENKLKGSYGDDILFMDAGNDVLNGDDGKDWVYIDSNISATIDLTNIGWQDTGFGLDKIVNIENLSGGSGNDVLLGNEFNNELKGNDGNDLLFGHGGDDYLYMDSGDDYLHGGWGDDRIVIDSNLDITIDLSITEAQDTGLGMDTILEIDGVYGGSGNDHLIGNDDYNVLWGNEGDDILAGGDKADVLNGGAGTDTADYSNDVGSIDVYLGTDGNGTAIDGWGASDALYEIENILGSQFNDGIYVNNPYTPNIIDGGDGIDVAGYPGPFLSTTGYTFTWNLDGSITATNDDVANYPSDVDTLLNIEIIADSLNNDTFLGNDQDNIFYLLGQGESNYIDGGDGIDTINFSGPTETVAVEFDHYISGVTIDLFNQTVYRQGKTDTIINIENVYGTNADDQIIGDDLSNLISGGAGNDILTGGGGRDIFLFAYEDDHLVTDTITDFDLTPSTGDALDISSIITDNNLILEDLLDFNFDSMTGDTTIHITGGWGLADKSIVLEGHDLTAGGTLSDSDIIDSLIANDNIIV